LATHAEMALRLGQERSVIFKGSSGEAQRNPEKVCRLALAESGTRSEETWQAQSDGSRFPWREETLDPSRVVALWHGERREAAPEAAVVGTVAIALRALGRVTDWRNAHDQAEKLWHSRKP
jgi:anthranilate phosphoribosyltransferase